jgi:putative ABC transport system permease protein
MIDSLRQLLRDLSAQKLRTTLTILGITWGTVAVIVLMAFGVGFEKQTRKNMHGMGDGIVIMFGGRTTAAFQGYNEGRPIRLREDDVALIATRVREVGDISPEYRRGGIPARVDTLSTMPTVTGVHPVYGRLRNILVEDGGRFLNDLDEAGRRRVVVLGDEIKKLLFGDRDALNQQIMLGNVPFTVIGVMAPKTQESSYGSRDTERVFIPAATHRAVFGDQYLANIVFKPVDASLSEPAKLAVREVLGSRYRFDPADTDAISMWDTSELDKMLDAIFLGISVFMGIVGAFTLVVGGVGVANIMYVVVRERTREIGIKRSIGARRRTVLGQFLMEAAFIVALGAVLGFLLSLGIIKAAEFLPFKDEVGVPELSAMVATLTIGLLALVSLFAGYFPARRAAAISPIEALRYGV